MCIRVFVIGVAALFVAACGESGGGDPFGAGGGAAVRDADGRGGAPDAGSSESGGSHHGGSVDPASDAGWTGDSATFDAGWQDPGSDTGSAAWEDTGSWAGEADTWNGGGGADAGASSDAGAPDEEEPQGNTNVNLGGTQDFGYFRSQLDDNRVPELGTFEASGFFAEHHTPLPTPDCGERVCVQGLLGVLSSLFSDATCTMLQLGLNSPLVADPSNRPPLSLTVVIDVSGSMDGAGKIEYVRAGLELMIDALRDDDEIALVTYSDGVTVAAEMGRVFGRRAALREVVSDLRTGGGTNLYGGLMRGYDLAESAYDSGRQNRVILLSDGEPSSGVQSVDLILEASASRNQGTIGLTTIGLGRSFNYALMSQLAAGGEGNFYSVENAAAVDEVFSEELSYFTVPVAYDLRLELETGSDYRIAAVHGTDKWVTLGEGGVLEIPSVFLAHRESHDDVTEGGGRRGGGSALIVELMPIMDIDDRAPDAGALVGRATLTFREPGTDAIIEETIEVTYPHAPWVMLDAGFFQADDTAIAQKSFVMLNLYVGMEEAIADFHAGRGEAAIEKLELLVAAVEDYNEEIGDVDIAFDIELVDQLHRVMLDNGALPPPAIDFPENPWPCD